MMLLILGIAGTLWIAFLWVSYFIIEARIARIKQDMENERKQNVTLWYCERCDYRNDHTNQSCSACGEESPL